MNLYLKNLILSKDSKTILLRKLFLLLALLCLWAWLSWQPAEQSYSDQTLLRPSQSHQPKLDTNKKAIKPLQSPKLDMIALSWIHQQKKIKESPLGSNKGDSISQWCVDVFGRDGVPWCAIYTSVLLNNTEYYPKIKTARAIGFAKNTSYTIKQVMTNQVILEPNWFAIKSRVGGNHVDLILDYNQATKEMTVRGGNVGDKVSMRKVKLSLTDRFGYQFFTPTYTN